MSHLKTAYYMGEAFAYAVVDGLIYLKDGRPFTDRDVKIRNICSEATTFRIIDELENNLIHRVETDEWLKQMIIESILDKYAMADVKRISHENLVDWIQYCIHIHGATAKGISTILLRRLDWRLVRMLHHLGERIELNMIYNLTSFTTTVQHRWLCARFFEQVLRKDEIEIIIGHFSKNFINGNLPSSIYTDFFRTQREILLSTPAEYTYIQRLASKDMNMWRFLVINHDYPPRITLDREMGERVFQETIEISFV